MISEGNGRVYYRCSLTIEPQSSDAASDHVLECKVTFIKLTYSYGRKLGYTIDQNLETLVMSTICIEFLQACDDCIKSSQPLVQLLAEGIL